ncbi:MAG: lipopolysaccharide heptosyltransferase II [Desulfobacterales bacterium]
MKRILIIRPSAIGDIVMASPMIRVLRHAWPRGHIAWLADTSVRGLLDNHPALDEVIYWSKEDWRRMMKTLRLLRLSSEVASFSRDLKKRRFDIALDGQGLLRSRLLAWLSGAAERVGFDSQEPGAFLMTRIVSRGPDKSAMSSEYIFLMRTMGLAPERFDPELVLAPRDGIGAETKLHSVRLFDRFAVICPFTTRPQKHWPEDRWASLARTINDRSELPLVLLGGPNDTAAARRFQDRIGAALYDFTGKTSLAEAAAIIERADLVIGVDTGLTHLGTAFKRPTVALFGATCPYLRTPSPKTVVVYNPQACAPCKRKITCAGRYDCMNTITVEQVLGAVNRVLRN